MSSQGGHQVGLAALEFVEQELGEELMVAVPLALLVQRNHEQVGAGELAQESGGTLPARHRVAERTRQPPQYRGLEQEPPDVLGETGKDLLSEEADDVAVGTPERFDESVLVL